MSLIERPIFEQYPNNNLYSDIPQLRTTCHSEKRVILSANERGEESVKNVCHALEKLNYISDIRITDLNSYEDCIEKKDIVVYLKPNFTKLEEIGIQVKSSFRGMLKFLHHFDPSDYSGAWEKIFRQRLALLNGQLKNHIIIDDFKYQLERIVKHNDS